MIILTTIALSLLVIVAGMFLLAHSRKNELSKVFPFTAYAVVIIGGLLFTASLIGGTVRIMTRHHGGACEKACTGPMRGFERGCREKACCAPGPASCIHTRKKECHPRAHSCFKDKTPHHSTPHSVHKKKRIEWKEKKEMKEHEEE